MLQLLGFLSSKRIILGIIISLSVALLMFIICEQILRIFNKQIPQVESVYDYTQFNINYGLEPKPNLHYEEFGAILRTNEWGMYSPSIEIEKKMKRIAYLGDSFTIAPGIDYRNNFPYRVTQNLQKDEGPFDYFVGGLGGSSAIPQALLFERKLQKFKPDIVVYELYDDIYRDYYWVYGPYGTRVRIWENVPTFLRNLRFVQTLIQGVINVKTKANEDYYQRTKENAFSNTKMLWSEYTAKGLDQILALTEENNSKFFLVCLPYGDLFSDEYASGSAKLKFNPICAYAKEWAKDKNVPFLDLYPNMARENTKVLNELYLDADHGFHLTVKGAGIVSDQITTFLKNSL